VTGNHSAVGLQMASPVNTEQPTPSIEHPAIRLSVGR